MLGPEPGPTTPAPVLPQMKQAAPPGDRNGLPAGDWGCGSLAGIAASAEGLERRGEWKAGAGESPAASWNQAVGVEGVLVAADSSEGSRVCPCLTHLGEPSLGLPE